MSPLNQARWSATALLMAVSISLLPLPAQAEGFLRAQGRKVVDGRGHPILLRGVGLGNWLLPEGYMFYFYRPMADRPRRMEAMVADLIGPEKAAAFWKTYYDRYITEDDIHVIAEAGFNSVRPALNARLFMSEEDGQLLEPGFVYIDRLVSWAKKHGIYVILDIHAAPGGQTGANIDDSVADHPELFRDPKFEERTIKLWVALAQRYKDETAVAAYDLLNEPIAPDHGVYNPKLEPLYKRITEAIRGVDKNHMITVEGAGWANDWSIFTKPPFDDNLLYQFHRYGAPPDPESVRQYVEKGKELDVPLWVGECGENNNDWYWGIFQLFEDHDIGWSFWPWKKISRGNNPAQIVEPKGWSDIVDYVNSGASKPSREAAQATFDEFLENIQMSRCNYRKEVVNAMLRRVPARIQAENYGYKGPGKSFEVKWEPMKEPDYRRDGPAESLSAVYRIGHTADGEWLSYDVESPSDGTFDLHFRVASGGRRGALRVELDGQDFTGPIAVPFTNGSDNWTVISKTGVEIPKGTHALRLFVVTGGFDIDWFSVRFAGAAEPPTTDAIELPDARASWTLPTRIEVEQFGDKGEGVSYHDADASNNGWTFRRKESVDLFASRLTGVRLNKDEWLSYEINSADAQSLKLSVQATVPKGDAELAFTLDGKPFGKHVRLKPSGPTGEATATQANLKVPAGRHDLRLSVIRGQTVVDWFELQ